MKVFLDTNVIIDFYDSSRGHYMPTAVVFDLALKGKIQLSVCVQSFITAFYLLRNVVSSTTVGEIYRSNEHTIKHILSSYTQIVGRGTVR